MGNDHHNSKTSLFKNWHQQQLDSTANHYHTQESNPAITHEIYTNVKTLQQVRRHLILITDLRQLKNYAHRLKEKNRMLARVLYYKAVEGCMFDSLGTYFYVYAENVISWDGLIQIEEGRMAVEREGIQSSQNSSPIRQWNGANSSKLTPNVDYQQTGGQSARQQGRLKRNGAQGQGQQSPQKYRQPISQPLEIQSSLVQIFQQKLSDGQTLLKLFKTYQNVFDMYGGVRISSGMIGMTGIKKQIKIWMNQNVALNYPSQFCMFAEGQGYMNMNMVVDGEKVMVGDLIEVLRGISRYDVQERQRSSNIKGSHIGRRSAKNSRAVKQKIKGNERLKLFMDGVKSGMRFEEAIQRIFENINREDNGYPLFQLGSGHEYIIMNSYTTESPRKGQIVDVIGRENYHHEFHHEKDSRNTSPLQTFPMNKNASIIINMNSSQSNTHNLAEVNRARLHNNVVSADVSPDITFRNCTQYQKRCGKQMSPINGYQSKNGKHGDVVELRSKFQKNDNGSRNSHNHNKRELSFPKKQLSSTDLLTPQALPVSLSPVKQAPLSSQLNNGSLEYRGKSVNQNQSNKNRRYYQSYLNPKDKKNSSVLNLREKADVGVSGGAIRSPAIDVQKTHNKAKKSDKNSNYSKNLSPLPMEMQSIREEGQFFIASKVGGNKLSDEWMKSIEKHDRKKTLPSMTIGMKNDRNSSSRNGDLDYSNLNSQQTSNAKSPRFHNKNYASAINRHKTAKNSNENSKRLSKNKQTSNQESVANVNFQFSNKYGSFDEIVPNMVESKRMVSPGMLHLNEKNSQMALRNLGITVDQEYAHGVDVIEVESKNNSKKTSGIHKPENKKREMKKQFDDVLRSNLKLNEDGHDNENQDVQDSLKMVKMWGSRNRTEKFDGCVQRDEEKKSYINGNVNMNASTTQVPGFLVKRKNSQNDKVIEKPDRFPEIDLTHSQSQETGYGSAYRSAVKPKYKHEQHEFDSSVSNDSPLLQNKFGYMKKQSAQSDTRLMVQPRGGGLLTASGDMVYLNSSGMTAKQRQKIKEKEGFYSKTQNFGTGSLKQGGQKVNGKDKYNGPAFNGNNTGQHNGQKQMMNVRAIEIPVGMPVSKNQEMMKLGSGKSPKNINILLGNQRSPQGKLLYNNANVNMVSSPKNVKASNNNYLLQVSSPKGTVQRLSQQQDFTNNKSSQLNIPNKKYYPVGQRKTPVKTSQIVEPSYQSCTNGQGYTLQGMVKKVKRPSQSLFAHDLMVSSDPCFGDWQVKNKRQFQRKLEGYNAQDEIVGMTMGRGIGGIEEASFYFGGSVQSHSQKVSGSSKNQPQEQIEQERYQQKDKEPYFQMMTKSTPYENVQRRFQNMKQKPQKAQSEEQKQIVEKQNKRKSKQEMMKMLTMEFGAIIGGQQGGSRQLSKKASQQSLLLKDKQKEKTNGIRYGERSADTKKQKQKQKRSSSNREQKEKSVTPPPHAPNNSSNNLNVDAENSNLFKRMATNSHKSRVHGYGIHIEKSKDQIIKEKVQQKKANFAELKKEALKILSDDLL